MELHDGKHLIEILDQQAGPCISMYLPTHRAGKEVEQNRIRYKNLLGQAENALKEGGHRMEEREELLDPARKLLDNRIFWENQLDGLAVFSCPGDFRHYRLPMPTDELVVVSDRTHLKPLLGPLSRDERFYILTFSKERVRLLAAQRYGLHETGLPKPSLITEQVVEFKTVQQELQFYTGAGPSAQPGGKREAIIFGGEETGKWPKKELLKEFKHISKGLQNAIENDRAPVVLAGIDYLHGFFRQATPFANVLDEGVTVNPDDLNDQELHERAAKVIDARLDRIRDEAAEQYQALAGAGSPRASKDVEAVVTASEYGRLESLFVAVGTQIWGRFDRETHSALVRGEHPEPGDYDLLDFAALNTLNKGGHVFAVAPEDVPSQVPVAAIYRY